MVVHLHSQDRKTRGYLFLKSISDNLLNINCMQSCFAVVKIIVRFIALIHNVQSIHQQKKASLRLSSSVLHCLLGFLEQQRNT